MDRTPAATMPSTIHTVSNASQGEPYVRIVEQPASRALRFRYECEGRSAGSIPGANSSPDNKTFPTVQVMNYRSPVVVVVSCVMKDAPYRPHPHNLVGREGCKKGICTMFIDSPDMTCSFTSLGIQCVKRKDVEESLRQREAIKVDPFRTGFGHRSQTSNIDLNVVRLCFQAFIQDRETKRFTIPLRPVVSDPIYDKKAMSDLIIMKLSHCSAPVSGGTEVILLCDRVTKDVQVRFYEEHNGQVLWEGFGDFQAGDVHKQVAISFRTPRYRDETVQQPISAFIQLRRPTDGIVSEPKPFLFTPRDADPEGLTRKRIKIRDGCLDRYLQDNVGNVGAGGGSGETQPIVIPRTIKTAKGRVKVEPGQSGSRTMWEQERYLQESVGAVGGSVPVDPVTAPTTISMDQYPVVGAPGTHTMPSHGLMVEPTLMNIPPVPMLGQVPIPFEVASSPGSATTHDLVAIAKGQVGDLSQSPRPPEWVENCVDEAAVRMDSLDLGIDPNDLSLPSGINLIDTGENMSLNLSTSMFDSGNLGTGMAVEPENQMPANSWQHIENELAALNNLCANTTDST